jgi:DNA-binding CsgD family transcriptional regulator
VGAQTLHWSIVARPALEQAVVQALAGIGAAVVVEGESGVGKSTLATQSGESLTRSVVRVVAMPELSTLPLAALAPLMRDAGALDATDRFAAAGETLASLRHDTVLVVDDAMHLDDLSAAAIYQACRIDGLRVLLTCRSGSTLPTALGRLQHEGIAATVIIDPFGADETERLLTAVLGGAPDPGTLARLQALSGGNPMLLREMLTAAAHDGAIALRDGVATVATEALPRRIDDLVADRVARLDPGIRRVLVLMAHTGPIPTSRLMPDVLRMLLEAGLVRTGAGFVAIAHDGFRDAITRSVTPAEARELDREAADLVGEGGLELVHAVRLRMRAGDAVAASDLVEAAAVALASHDLDLAADLAGTASALGSLDAEIVLGEVASGRGDDTTAIERFEAVVLAADDPVLVGRAGAALARHLAIRVGDPARAIEALDAALAAGGDPARLEAERVKWRAMAGGALEPPVPPPAGSGDEAVLGALIATAMVQTLGGRLAEARASIGAARPMVAAVGAAVPGADVLLDLDEYLAAVFDGELAEAASIADERIDPGAPHVLGLWTYVLALQHQQTGRLGEARRLAERSVRALQWFDLAGVLGAAQALLATIHARLGETARAEAVLAAIGPERYGDVKVVLQAAEARSWMLFGRDRPHDAARTAIEAAELGVVLGHPTLAALTAFTAVLQGSPEGAVGVLERAAASGDARLLQLHAQHGAAEAGQDAVALERIGSAYADIGHALGAVAAWRSAATLLERDRRSREAATIRARVATLGDVEGLPGRRDRSIDLTPRELEVALLAGARARSREIAERFGISARTVEHQLGSVYRKLGISSRDELRDALVDAGVIVAE